MEKERLKGRAQMYVLSIQDIQRIRNCSYKLAAKELKSMDYFYINSKPYVLARDYFGATYGQYEVTMFEPIVEGIETKLVKVFPLLLDVDDIQAIFNCGARQAQRIMNTIDGTFRLNNKKYVRDKDFECWLDALPKAIGMQKEDYM